MKARLCPAAAAARRESPCPLRWRTGAAARAKARLSRPGGWQSVHAECAPTDAPAAASAAVGGGGGGGGLLRAVRSGWDRTRGGWIRRKRRSMSASVPSQTRWRDKSGLERPHLEAGAPGRWRVAPLARSAHGGGVRRLNAGPLQRPRFSIHTRVYTKMIPLRHFFYPKCRPVCGGTCHVRSALRLRNQAACEATPIRMPLGAAQSGFPEVSNRPGLGQSIPPPFEKHRYRSRNTLSGIRPSSSTDASGEPAHAEGALPLVVSSGL